MTAPALTLRDAEPADMPAVHRLICELAVYERAGDEVEVTPEQLVVDGFGAARRFETVVAEANGEVVGMALFYPRYSTWKGMCCYLEDLIVTESYRGQGIGSMLLRGVVQRAYAAGAARIQWQVLDWNTPSITFYEKAGAFIDKEWYDCKMNRHAMKSYLTGAQTP